MDDGFEIAGEVLGSRLILGTGGVPSMTVLEEAITASGTAMVTVALRRVTAGVPGSILDVCDRTGVRVLPNTAGCLSAREAVKTASMARELFETDLIKLEVIGDEASLQPDPFGLVEAASELVRLGFRVLPYCTEDWVVCRRLMDAGCEVLMPWAAPIGTGQGPRNARGLRELRERADAIPLIVDAGLGLPSHACQVMEWGFDGVLLNTAVSRAINPVRMPGALQTNYFRRPVQTAPGSRPAHLPQGHFYYPGPGKSKTGYLKDHRQQYARVL